MHTKLDYIFSCTSDGNSKGIAYIVYSTQEDAARCVEQFNNTKFQDKVIRVKMTRQKGGGSKWNQEDENPEVKEEADEHYEEEPEDKYDKRWNPVKDKSMRKQGRIVVRNLSFKVSSKCFAHLLFLSLYYPFSLVYIHGSSIILLLLFFSSFL